MNTRHAQIVLTIARFGSITAAAKALYITQPTLSQTLKQIETQLGEPLFMRGRTPMELTPAGELYVQAARRIIQIETHMSEAIAHLSGKLEGTLHLGMPRGRSGELLPQVLPEYLTAYPDIRVEVTEGSPSELEHLLIRREIDMAFFASDTRRQDLCYRLIGAEEIVLLAGKSTPIARRIPSGTTISLQEAADERFILPAHTMPSRRIFDSLLEQAGIPCTAPALTLDNMDAARRLTAACQLVTLCPFISLLCDTPSLQKLAHYHLTGEASLSRFVLAHPSDTTLPPYAEAFFNLVSNRFRAMSAYRA